MNRRDILRLSGTAIAGLAPRTAQNTGTRKEVIVLVACIAGLSSAYELKNRGHDLTVLEASGRPGGHWNLSNPSLSELWAMADEVKTPCGMLVGNGQPGVTAATSIAAFLKHYPGR